MQQHTHSRLRSNLLPASLLAMCGVTFIGCSGRATKFYAASDFRGDMQPRDPSQVEVVLNDGTPKCPYREIGTISYDWARDGVFTSQSVAMEGVIEKAAKIGASGIYK